MCARGNRGSCGRCEGRHCGYMLPYLCDVPTRRGEMRVRIASDRRTSERAMRTSSTSIAHIAWMGRSSDATITHKPTSWAVIRLAEDKEGAAAQLAPWPIRQPAYLFNTSLNRTEKIERSRDGIQRREQKRGFRPTDGPSGLVQGPRAWTYLTASSWTTRCQNTRPDDYHVGSCPPPQIQQRRRSDHWDRPRLTRQTLTSFPALQTRLTATVPGRPRRGLTPPTARTPPSGKIKGPSSTCHRP